MDLTPLQKPAEFAENQLINAILEGRFPIASVLPAERELASRLGVTRPTLREALQRLARDGWIEIRQGKPTRVRDYWHEGSLGVLNAIAHRPWAAPGNFVSNLLEVRLVLAPEYTRLAVQHDPGGVIALMETADTLPHDHDSGEPAQSEEVIESIAQQYAEYDWELHHGLTILSGNPIYTLILNGFCELYVPMGRRYFLAANARSSSRLFYGGLLAAAQTGDAVTAEAITRRVMSASLALWKQAKEGEQPRREAGPPEVES